MEYAIGSAVTKAILGNPTLSTICVQSTIQCVQTLMVTTQEIYGFITTIKETTSHVDIANLLVELDLEPEVLLLDSLLKEINIEKHHTQTLAISLKSLDQSLNDILKLLSEVNKKVDYNKKLWFTLGGWRCKNFDGIGEKLRCYKSNLDKRKANLFEILKINSFLVPVNHKDSQSSQQLLSSSKSSQKQIVYESEDDENNLNISVLSVDKLKPEKGNIPSYNIRKTYKQIKKQSNN